MKCAFTEPWIGLVRFRWGDPRGRQEPCVHWRRFLPCVVFQCLHIIIRPFLNLRQKRRSRDIMVGGGQKNRNAVGMAL